MNRLMVGPDYENLRDNLTTIDHGQTMRFETEAVGEPLLAVSSGLKLKRFPNCGSAHRAMDALLVLIEQHGFEAGDAAAIDVRAPLNHLNNLMYTDPHDAAQAKFSLEYALALLLVTGNCTLADFEDEAWLRPEIRALYPRIHRHPVDKPEGAFPTEVEVTLRDGRRFSASVSMPAGSIAAPFSEAQLWAKFDGCVGDILTTASASALRNALESLPGLPTVAPLTAPLGGPFE
jgi:2-methylcitrate dehydratase PrpD